MVFFSSGHVCVCVCLCVCLRVFNGKSCFNSVLVQDQFSFCNHTMLGDIRAAKLCQSPLFGLYLFGFARVSDSQTRECNPRKSLLQMALHIPPWMGTSRRWSVQLCGRAQPWSLNAVALKDHARDYGNYSAAGDNASKHSSQIVP